MIVFISSGDVQYFFKLAFDASTHPQLDFFCCFLKCNTSAEAIKDRVWNSISQAFLQNYLKYSLQSTHCVGTPDMKIRHVTNKQSLKNYILSFERPTFSIGQLYAGLVLNICTPTMFLMLEFLCRDSDNATTEVPCYVEPFQLKKVILMPLSK